MLYLIELWWNKLLDTTLLPIFILKHPFFYKKTFFCCIFRLFLPYNLKSHFDKLGNSNISNGNLVETSILFGEYNEYKETSFSPLYVLLILSLIIVIVTFFDYLRITRSVILDLIILLITGIIGILLVYLWFFSNHAASAWNYNLLWAIPFNLILLIQLLKKKQNRRTISWLKINVLMLLLMCLHWMIGIQVFNICLISLILALLIRYLYLITYLSKRIRWPYENLYKIRR